VNYPLSFNQGDEVGLARRWLKEIQSTGFVDCFWVGNYIVMQQLL